MALQNSLVKKKETGLTAFLSSVNVAADIDRALGRDNRQRFVTGIVSAVTNNSDLRECSNESLLSAALLGESLKLSPSPQLGHYYMVPFKDNARGIRTAQFVMGYKGYIQLAIRSGQYRKLNVVSVKDGELEYFDPMNEEIRINRIRDWNAREKAETIGYYAMFELVNGFRKAIYWSREQMEAHAAEYSKGYAAKKGYTFWEKRFDDMAYKTMLRQLISKWGIMSIDMITAFEGEISAETKREDSSEPAPVAEPKREDIIDVDVVTEAETEEDAAAALFGG